jgi:flagellar protein FlgJ
VSVHTLEYRDGTAVRERAEFRAYDSPRDSFADYVDFLRGNARYAPALEAAGDDAAYVRALQDAGYATDPAYADKILSIIERGALDGADDALKKTAAVPLSG